MVPQIPPTSPFSAMTHPADLPDVRNGLVGNICGFVGQIQQ